MSKQNLTTKPNVEGSMNIMRPGEQGRKRASMVIDPSEAVTPSKPAPKKVGRKVAPRSSITTILLAATAGAAGAVPLRAVPTHDASRVLVRAPQAAEGAPTPTLLDLNLSFEELEALKKDIDQNRDKEAHLKAVQRRNALGDRARLTSQEILVVYAKIAHSACINPVPTYSFGAVTPYGPYLYLPATYSDCANFLAFAKLQHKDGVPAEHSPKDGEPIQVTLDFSIVLAGDEGGYDGSLEPGVTSHQDDPNSVHVICWRADAEQMRYMTKGDIKKAWAAAGFIATRTNDGTHRISEQDTGLQTEAIHTNILAKDGTTGIDTKFPLWLPTPFKKKTPAGVVEVSRMVAYTICKSDIFKPDEYCLRKCHTARPCSCDKRAHTWRESTMSDVEGKKPKLGFAGTGLARSRAGPHTPRATSPLVRARSRAHATHETCTLTPTLTRSAREAPQAYCITQPPMCGALLHLLTCALNMSHCTSTGDLTFIPNQAVKRCRGNPPRIYSQYSCARARVAANLLADILGDSSKICKHFKRGQCSSNKMGRVCFFQHPEDPSKIECNLDVAPNGTYCKNGRFCLYLHPNQGLYNMEQAKAAKKGAGSSSSDADLCQATDPAAEMCARARAPPRDFRSHTHTYARSARLSMPRTIPRPPRAAHPPPPAQPTRRSVRFDAGIPR